MIAMAFIGGSLGVAVLSCFQNHGGWLLMSAILAGVAFGLLLFMAVQP